MKINFLKKISKGAKASIVYTIASLITKSISIITLPLFTNILSTSEVGLSNIYTSWHSILFVVASFSLCSAAYNIGLHDFKNERNQFTLSLMSLSSLTTMVLFVVYLCFRAFFNDLFTLSTPLMCLMFLTFFVEPAYDFWMYKQRFEYKYKLSACVSVLYSILTATVSIVAVLSLQNKELNLGEVKVFSSAIFLILYCLIFLVFFIIKGRHKPTLKYWKYIIPIAFPLIIHSLAGQVLSVSDRTMISKMCGQDKAGIYSTLYNIASLASILWTAINGSLIPFMFDKLSDKDTAKKNLNKIIIPLLVFYAIFALTITFVAPEIVSILTNEEYASAVYIIPPIAAGIFLTAIYNIFGNVLSFQKKTYFIMIGTIIAAISNIILNMIFIPIFGFVAASYTTLVCYIILAVAFYILMRFSYKEDIVNPMILLLISCITIALCLVSNILYKFLILRYVIIALVFILVFIFRKKIINLLLKLKEKN